MSRWDGGDRALGDCPGAAVDIIKGRRGRRAAGREAGIAQA